MFIADAKEEWEDFKSKSPLRAVEEISSKDSEDSEEGSVESTEGELFDGVYLLPEEFDWKAPIKKGPDFTMPKRVDKTGVRELDKETWMSFRLQWRIWGSCTLSSPRQHETT